jgi:Ca2+-binding EF-hand superfamily protein
MWENLDVDHSGVITFPEFLPLCLDIHEILSDENIRATFCSYDSDNCGFIHEKVIHDVLSAEGIIEKNSMHHHNENIGLVLKLHDKIHDKLFANFSSE